MKKALYGKIIILIFLCCSPVILISAQESAGVSNLFVSSSPLGCEVIFDGEMLGKTTPLLLEKIESGFHRIELKKEGFLPTEKEIELVPHQTQALDVLLGRSYFSSSFPGEQMVIVNNTDIYTGWDLYTIPNGDYRIIQQSDELRIDPLYPKEGLLKAMKITLPILLLLDGLLTLNDVRLKDETPRLFSPSTITAYICTAGVGGAALALNSRKKTFLNSFSIEPVSRENASSRAAEYFTEAENYLALGRLSRAQESYLKILDSYKDSVYYPEALYKNAKIFYISGEYEKAVSDFSRILEDFPIPQLYDKTCKSLADLYVQTGEYEKSLQILDKIVYFDPVYTREDIDFFRCEINERWYSSDSSILEQVVSSYIHLVYSYADSADSDYYKYKTAFYLAKAGNFSAAQTLLAEVTEPNAELAPLVKQLSQSIRESNS